MRRVLLVMLLTVSLAIPPIPISADGVSGPLPETGTTRTDAKPEPESEDAEEASEGEPEETIDAGDTGTTANATEEPDIVETDTDTETAEENGTEPSAEDTDPDKKKSGTEEVSPTDSLPETESGALPASEDTTGTRTATEADDPNPESGKTDDTSAKEAEAIGTGGGVAAQSPKDDTTLNTQTKDDRSLQDGTSETAIFIKTEAVEDIPDIIISEFQIKGEKTADDFVELYNTTNETIGLDGLELRRKTKGDTSDKGTLFHAFDTDNSIRPGGFFLWANKDGEADFIALADTVSDNQTSPALTDNNSLALFDENESILDAATWGSDHTAPFSSPSIGENPGKSESYVRDPKALLWSLSEAPTPTNSDGETVEGNPSTDLPPPGTVILNEIFPNPIDEADEWVELFNVSDEEIPLSGWILADAAKEYVLSDGTLIEAGGFLIIPRSDSGLALNNGSETVTLSLPNGTVSATFQYTKTVEESSWARDETGAFKLTAIPTRGETNRFPVVKEPYLAPLPPDDSLRINEVFANPETRGEADEWIEFANTSDMDIPLAGFILRDASKSGKYIFGDAVAIGAGSFLVLPRSETGISLNNSTETLHLLWHDDDTIIASLSYARTVEGASYGYYRDGRYRFSGQATPGEENRFGKEPEIEEHDIPKKGYRDVPVAFAAEGSGKNMRYVWDFGDEHKSYRQETTHRYEETGTYRGTLTVRGDIEEVVKTFTIRIEKYPKYDLRIEALLPNPDGRDTDFEWIRIGNREKKSVDLTDWIIATGTTEDRLVNHKILTEDLSIGAGESLMLTRTDSRFSLPNKRAVIELRRPDGSRADRVVYDRSDGIGEEELLTITEDGALVWIRPASGTDDTPPFAVSTAAGNPFLAGMTARPDRYTFSRFLALGTPFHITLPESAARVLGLSDARTGNGTGSETREPAWLDEAFKRLNGVLLSTFGK